VARSRNIKPGIMENEVLAELAPLERLLFIYMWMLADRQGRLEDRPKRIKAKALPYDDADVDAILGDLQDRGFVIRYEASGGKFIQIVNFLKHQKPHSNETQSEIPPCSDELLTLVASSCDHSDEDCEPEEKALGPCISDCLIPDSLIPDSGLLGESGVQTAVNPPAARSDRSRGTRLEKDWALPKTWGEWALHERPDWNADAVRKVADQFRDHWIAKSGADARKADWEATWRNWVRREKSLSGAANLKTGSATNRNDRSAAAAAIFGAPQQAKEFIDV